MFTHRISKFKVWQHRFRKSITVRFLPLVFIVCVTLIIAVLKWSKPNEFSVAVIPAAEAENLCNNFCGSLLYCGADYLAGHSESVSVNIKSACYTGCMKHTRSLLSCSTFLEEQIAKTEDDCNKLKRCIQPTNRPYQKSQNKPVTNKK